MSAPEWIAVAVVSSPVNAIDAIDVAGLVALCVLLLCVGRALAAWAFRGPL